MRVAAFQFDVRRGDVTANLEAVQNGLRAASEAGIELVCLPEMWPTSFVAGVDDETWLVRTGEALDRVRDLSRELGLVVCGSAFGAGDEGQRLRNRLHVYDRGESVLSYDKLHLFSPTAEGEGFSAGEDPPPTVRVRSVELSGVVCYDLRFPPLLRAPYLDGAELLVVPAQWPETRARHWEALVRGRAVEHQAFVLAVNRTGKDVVGNRKLELSFPGNSLIVGPHGDVLAEGRGEQGLVQAAIDLREVRHLRRTVPVRRDDQARRYRSWGL